MENKINTIAVWGDSILKGAVTGYSERRFDVIKENGLALASSSLGFTLINKSVFGNIINKSQHTLLRDIERGLTCDLGIIESGGNDCDYDWTPISENPDKDYLPRNTLSDFIRIMNEMVQTLRGHRITPLLMTMIPLVVDKWYKTITNGQNENNINKFLNGNFFNLYYTHELYSNTILKYALQNNVQIIDMRQEFLKSGNISSLMCEDGIHPNKEGHVFMSKVWEKELPRIKKEF